MSIFSRWSPCWSTCCGGRRTSRCRSHASKVFSVGSILNVRPSWTTSSRPRASGTLSWPSSRSITYSSSSRLVQKCFWKRPYYSNPKWQLCKEDFWRVLTSAKSREVKCPFRQRNVARLFKVTKLAIIIFQVFIQFSICSL